MIHAPNVTRAPFKLIFQFFDHLKRRRPHRETLINFSCLEK